MNVYSLCTEQIDENKSTNINDETNENTIEIPFDLFQFLSATQCNTQGLCRICLSINNNVMFSLYCTKEMSMVATMLKAITGIEIYPGDGLPENVCESCQTQIVSSYRFKLQCEKGTSILKSVLRCFIKDEQIINNSPDHIPEYHNINIGNDCDILDLAGKENLNHIRKSVDFTDTVKQNNCSTVIPTSPNTAATMIKKEFESSKSEDVEYLDDEVSNENYKVCSMLYKKDQKKKKGIVSVKDSKTLFNEIVSDKLLSKKKRSRSYLCKFCNKKFFKLKLLSTHLSTNHRNKQNTDLEYSCSHCGDSFSSEHDLNLHSTLHSKGPKWRCNQCEKVYETKSILRRHIYRHMESKRYSCDSCGKLFTELYALRRHSRVHTGETIEKKHKCHLCDKKYSESGLLAAHLARHEGCRPYVCSVCGKAFPSTRLLASHSLTHSDNKRYACNYCDKRFRHESTRNTHHRTHTGEKPYVCSTCGKTFIQNSNLKLHMRTHTGEKPYSCTICNRKFSSGSSLKTHERTHTGERPYECKICKKRFARVNMRAHMHTHTGERPFACSICPKKFLSSTRLRDHARVHTGEKPFECEFCLQKFQTKSHLLRHVKTHIKEKKAIKKHDMCNPEFMTSTNVHMKSSDNNHELSKEDTSADQECRTIVFGIEEVPLGVSSELVLQDESNVKTEMLIIDGSQNYQAENILDGNSVIVSDINYANNVVSVNEANGDIASSGTVLEGATVKLYQLDQSLLQIHSAGGQLTISKITSKMTANF